MKFDPFTVSVKAGEPRVVLAGERDMMAGTGLVVTELMVNTDTLEVPPPGVPVKTVIFAVPAEASKKALTDAVTCDVLKKVVGSAAPFQFTIDPLMKLVPVTVSVNAGSPAVALEGEIAEMEGTGFIVPPPFTVDVFLQDRPMATVQIMASSVMRNFIFRGLKFYLCFLWRGLAKGFIQK